MNPEFDDRDQAILAARITQWERQAGPRVGDFVHMPDGSLRRFTHHWGDGLQTTCGHPCAGDQSFYFAGAYMSFSGSLDSSIDIARITDTGEQKDGKAWFFHHDFMTAHNGVTVTVPCRVYKVECGGETVALANARLIAAAPDLLAALQRMYAAMEAARTIACGRPIAENALVTHLQTAGGAMLAAQYAIARATGEQS